MAAIWRCLVVISEFHQTCKGLCSNCQAAPKIWLCELKVDTNVTQLRELALSKVTFLTLECKLEA